MALAIYNIKAARVITQFDIARWYLDSDMVLVCSAHKVDTIFLSRHDSYSNDSIHLYYEIIREIYCIDTDSIIKPNNTQYNLIDSIYSQGFSINYAQTKQGDDEYIYSLNELGVTLRVDTFKTLIMYEDFYSDDSYFRIKNNNKHLVILSLTQQGYVIDYKTEITDWILELITEVQNKGQAYFDDFFKIDNN